MRKIGDASFFRIVDRLLEPGTTRVPRTAWSIEGVEWQRERHSYAGASHGFTVENPPCVLVLASQTIGVRHPSRPLNSGQNSMP